MNKDLIKKNRLRRIEGSFAFIEHRFMRQGHLALLSKHELLLYFFFALTGDVNGLSFYGVNTILRLLKLEEAEYYQALSALEQKDYIALKGSLVQLLSLPVFPIKNEQPLKEQRRCSAFSLAEIIKAAGGYHG